MKIAILSNVNADNLARFLKEKSPDKSQDFYIAGFNQYAQEILNENSQLYKFSPELLLLHIEGAALFEDIFFNQFSYDYRGLNSIINERIEELWLLVEGFLKQIPQCLLFLNTISLSPYTIGGALEANSEIPSLQVIPHLFNKQLTERKLSSDYPSVYIYDWEKVVFLEGFRNIYDIRYWYLGRMPYNNYGYELLAQGYLDILNSIKGKLKKVIALDLDNTLWGGIIGEDGLSGIKISEEGIGKAYRDFQKFLKGSKDKGILLTVVSKNNLKDVKEVFENNPLMVIKEDDFVSVKVNWKNKAENISQIANELNLGLDAIVFIDDDPVERELVKSMLPDVAVPDFPEDPANLAIWFSQISGKYFNTLYLTDEDRQRTQMYKAQVQRGALSKLSYSMEDFLKHLNMQMVIFENHTDMLERLAQLTQRTNQFNLRSKRYTQNELLSFMDNKDYCVWGFELKDKFGTHGIAGLMIVKFNKNQEAFIDTFLMSCRIIGRGAEQGFFAYVVSVLKKRGIKSIIGEYIATNKNKLAEDLYDKLGFSKKGQSGKDGCLWELNLSNFNLSKPSYIEIKSQDDFARV